jgi:adenylate cyclase
MAAQKLRDFAISYGAEGSVMVMVVNVSDLFFNRGGRSRGTGSGPQIMSDPSTVDADANFMRAVRRRYEEVGDRTLNRLQQEIEPPQGQIAIVFTDIVNSTHLWETNPSMPTAIKMHHNLMRRQLRLDGGYEVKTEGDSFMVSFQTVTAAILLECPDGNVVHDSEGNIVQRGLRVRMGIHWGGPQCERDPITRRMDYYGPMVNRAARINASADGGQLMASQDVIYEIELLRDYLDSLDDEGLTDLPAELKREVQEIKRVGIEIKNMGERKLKGLEGEVLCLFHG